MFTGIIELMGEVKALKKEGDNLHITIHALFDEPLKIDQSIAHNGTCLTVVDIKGNEYTVTAIRETLNKTNLGYLKVGDKVNLERCVKVGARLDGHIVQGHVDTTATCISVKEQQGSWLFVFQYSPGDGWVTVKKGSVCVNGISLTVVESGDDYFSVAIIPYTFHHTTLGLIREGDTVNLEFDIIGKYIARINSLR